MAAVQQAAFMDVTHPGHPPEYRRRLSAHADLHRDRGDLVVWVSYDPLVACPAEDLVLSLPMWAYAPAVGALSSGGAGLPDPDSSMLAVVETMIRNRLSADQCFAYGDLCGDSPVFDLVGNPRIVACGQAEAAYARSRGLPVIDQLP